RAEAGSEAGRARAGAVSPSLLALRPRPAAAVRTAARAGRRRARARAPPGASPSRRAARGPPGSVPSPSAWARLARARSARSGVKPAAAAIAIVTCPAIAAAELPFAARRVTVLSPLDVNAGPSHGNTDR